MILADTSVWVEHLRHGCDPLRELLSDGRVCCHQFVIGEIALGRLSRRRSVLSLLSELPVARPATHEEVLAFVEQRDLAGAGIGWVDAHLLASVAMDGLRLWTFDRRLAACARRIGLAW